MVARGYETRVVATGKIKRERRIVVIRGENSPQFNSTDCLIIAMCTDRFARKINIRAPRSDIEIVHGSTIIDTFIEK